MFVNREAHHFRKQVEEFNFSKTISSICTFIPFILLFLFLYYRYQRKKIRQLTNSVYHIN